MTSLASSGPEWRMEARGATEAPGALWKGLGHLSFLLGSPVVLAHFSCVAPHPFIFCVCVGEEVMVKV